MLDSSLVIRTLELSFVSVALDLVWPVLSGRDLFYPFAVGNVGSFDLLLVSGTPSPPLYAVSNISLFLILLEYC